MLFRSRALALALVLFTSAGFSAGASAQELVEEIPPPPAADTSPEVLPSAESESLPPPPQAAPPAAPVRVRRAPQAPYEWNPSAPSTPTSGSQFGNPDAPPPAHVGTHRGDSLIDRAQGGEIIDLMITSGAYGMLLANGIVNWSGADSSGGSDLVSIRFGATFVGATLSLTGLLTIDAPRGVPTAMTIGLRYGTVAGGLLAGAIHANGNGSIGAMVVGGLLGYGLGAGLGYGLRPHISRSRFVEAGAFWGAGLGFLMSGALRGDDRATWGLGLGGMSFGILTHALVASLNNVSAGRGWLLNAAFAAPAGLAALIAVVATDGHGAGEVVYGIAAAAGLLGLGIIFAVTDGIQDPGWMEDEVISSLQLGVAPSADGQGGTVSLSGQF